MAEDEIVFLPIDKISQQTEDQFLFRFKTTISHDPGQFFQCSLLGIGESAISICSHSENFFELSIRSVGNVTNKLCNLKKGDQIGLRGPYGHGYEMEQFHNKDMVIIGGGSGVAPLRGILEHLSKYREKFGTVEIFFGFRGEKDILFESDFEKWQKKDMSLAFTLSEEHKHPKAKKGFVTNILENLKVTKNKLIFLCGPPIMITNTAKMLLEKGFMKSQIYVSEERQMKCAVGRCGHCMIKGKYCCTDGPVFRYDELY
ncbi:FAD/NAD(P)-binding protein [Candidatus Gracilibacteria bacterium]|nr:FAD/NAD(P)-binding protein [Candidatus Gracilibacteria bacterium]